MDAGLPLGHGEPMKDSPRQFEPELAQSPLTRGDSTRNPPLKGFVYCLLISLGLWLLIFLAYDYLSHF